MKSFIFVALLFGIVLTLSARANEGHENSGSGEEHDAEVGHEGGHGGKASSVLPTVEWVDVEGKISATHTMVKAKEENIRKLIDEKNHLDDKSPRLKEIVKEMAKEHREYRELQEEEDRQKTILKYKFPERGAEAKRKYGTSGKKSIESLSEMEHRFSTEERLEKTMNAVEKAYDTEGKKKSLPGQREKETKGMSPEENSILLQK